MTAIAPLLTSAEAASIPVFQRAAARSCCTGSTEANCGSRKAYRKTYGRMDEDTASNEATPSSRSLRLRTSSSGAVNACKDACSSWRTVSK